MARGVVFVCLALLALSTPALAQKGKPSTPSLTPLAWYDNTGKLVGLATPGGVLARVGEDVFHVALGQAWTSDPNAPHGSFVVQVASGSNAVYFSGNNCTGQAYVPRADVAGTTRTAAVLKAPDGVVTIYYAVSPPLQTTVTASSVIDGGPSTCRSIGETGTFVPVAGSVIFSGLWTPPFYLK